MVLTQGPPPGRGMQRMLTSQFHKGRPGWRGEIEREREAEANSPIKVQDQTETRTVSVKSKNNMVMYRDRK